MITLSPTRLVCIGLMSIVMDGVYQGTRKSGDEILRLPGVALFFPSNEQSRAKIIRGEEDILSRSSAKEAIARDLLANRISLHEAAERIDALNAGESALHHRERRKNFPNASAEAIHRVRRLPRDQPDRDSVIARLEKELGSSACQRNEIP